MSIETDTELDLCPIRRRFTALDTLGGVLVMLVVQIMNVADEPDVEAGMG
jgi:hypothetical protein